MQVYTLILGSVKTNCYIVVNDKKDCFIVDPGDEPATVIAQLNRLGAVVPKAIFLTHGHFDHIGAVEALMDNYTTTELYIGEKELEIVKWSEPYLQRSGLHTVVPHIMETANLVKDEQEIAVGEFKIKVIATPGHTKGGVVYTVDDKMFSGDTLFREEIGRCDLFTGDYEVMLATLQKLASLETDYTIYPGHEEFTTLSHERLHNPYINR